MALDMRFSYGRIEESGRMSLEAESLAYLSIKGDELAEVYVICAVDRIEIWSQDYFWKFQETDLAPIQVDMDVTDQVELPLPLTRQK